MKREPRLQFSDADLAEPKLGKPIKRVKKAEAKADKAQAKIPKKTVVKKERGFDPATGKVKTQLRFEEVDKKKPPSKLTHAVQDAPANFVLSQVHREVRQSEDDNVGVEAAHKVEQAVESGGRLVQSANRAHQLKPYRAAIRAEKKLERANLDALQKKAEIDSPTSNPVSKWQQKQAIKKQYAAAKHNQAAQTTAKAAENTAKAAKKAAEKAEKAGKYVWEHRRGFAIAAAILLMLAFLLNGLSSCSVIMDGVGSGIAASTYPSQDADMLGAEAQYCEMEAELQRYLDTYESTHDYDEYHFDLDTIEHDPYVLISMITALHQGEWTLDEVQGTLQMLFDRQYILTEDVVVETRYRTETDTWTDADGNTHTLESKNGNTFYLIIDRDDEGEETVHFLNQVDEADLMALTGEEETPATCSCTTKCVAGTVNTSCPVCAVNMTECVGKEAKPEAPTEPTEPAAEEPEKKSGVGGILVVLLIVALGGGAAFYIFKQKKAKPQTKGSADLDDYDYGEDEDEYEFEPYEDEPEQDTTEDTNV